MLRNKSLFSLAGIISLLFLGLLAGGVVLCGGCSNLTPAQQLSLNENFEATLDVSYSGAATLATQLYSEGKISSSDWTNKVEPAFTAANAAIVAYHNAYEAALSPAPGTSGSLQAAQAAIQGFLNVLQAFQTGTVGLIPPTPIPPIEIPAAPTSALLPPVTEPNTQP